MLSHIGKQSAASVLWHHRYHNVKVGELIVVWKKASFIVPWIRRLVCQSRAGLPNSVVPTIAHMTMSGSSFIVGGWKCFLKIDEDESNPMKCVCDDDLMPDG